MRSVPVSVRVLHMPGPGAGDDFFDVLELRFPAEFGADFFRAGDEARRVAGAAR